MPFKMRSSARVGGTGFLRLVIRSSLKSLSYEMPARLSTIHLHSEFSSGIVSSTLEIADCLVKMVSTCNLPVPYKLFTSPSTAPDENEHHTPRDQLTRKFQYGERTEFFQ